MSLVRYEPANLLDQFQRELTRFFEPRTGLLSREFGETLGAQWAPAVDIREEANALVLLADVPGVEPNKIEVTAANGMLTLKGERSSEKEIKEKDYRRVERSYGSFYRSFSLPEYADTEHITAKTKDGVLEVRIPKTAKSSAKRISVEG